jgi:TonB family protein
VNYNTKSYGNSPQKNSNTIGFLSTIIFHITLVTLLFSAKYTVIPPSRPISNVEIELLDNTKVGIPRNVKQKKVENPPIINNPGKSAPKDARIDKSNQSTRPTKQPNARPSTLSDVGDIEKPLEKPREINRRALFQSTSDGSEDANNPNNIHSQSLFPGVGNNTEVTRSINTPIGPEHRQMVTASLSGRSVVGELPIPSYKSQNQGRVLVEVTVDQNGVVTKASAQAKGSTVQDAALWKAAEEAALKARFNVKRDAPVFQKGTITYNFILK